MVPLVCVCPPSGSLDRTESDGPTNLHVQGPTTLLHGLATTVAVPAASYLLCSASTTVAASYLLQLG